ncbi:MAG: hypothetical protein A2V62_12330 [Nitrospirae bacterium RBG_19FT_COMBO_58_9]|nr:MAG: hypothetical protein A2V62_12330 [Nitrospirae bacterium RBG_19FT_COMBO_58_9]
MWVFSAIAVVVLIMGPVGEGQAEDIVGTSPLLTITPKDLHRILPPDSHLLIGPHAIEQFLDVLDGAPPDWGPIYGHGHHDSDIDERLFALNRERDAKRAGNPALTEFIAFVWFGELSGYDAEAGGFRVALGPKLTPTRWGVVRFKYEDLQGELVAKASATLRGELEQRFARGESVDITVAMTGRLIPDESVVYDFSHDQEGLGVIMPVVKVERLDYLLTNLN